MTATLRELRPHQEVALDGLRHSIMAGHTRPMLSLSTGAGKTVVAAHIVAGARRKGKRVGFCVPALSLIDQTFERFRENGIDPAEMGVLQGDHQWRRPHAPIQICSAQTLAVRGVPEVDVAVIDEAHVKFKIYEKWIKGEATPGQKPPVFIGLSATPWTKGLGKLFDDLIRPTSLQALIDAGYLSPFRVFAPSHPDLTGVKIRNGDYAEEQLAERMDRPELVADVVRTWLDKGRGRPTLCFATGRQHAQNLRDRFAEAGVRVAYIDANTPREERDEIGRKLAIGEIELVTNIGCLTTGIDWDVRCIIVCRPTKSESLFVQIIGRGLRTADGKDHCLVLDHSDTHLRLGMVTEIEARQDELDMGRDPKAAAAKPKERTNPLPKECQSCGCLVPVGVKECPACGYVAPAPQFREADGSLSELVPGVPRAPGFKRNRGESVTDALHRMGPEACWAQIRWVQEERDRKRGWAAHKFKDLFDDWPPRKLEGIKPEEPGSLMRGWIRSRDIAWARAQRSDGELSV